MTPPTQIKANASPYSGPTVYINGGLGMAYQTSQESGGVIYAELGAASRHFGGNLVFSGFARSEGDRKSSFAGAKPFVHFPILMGKEGGLVFQTGIPLGITTSNVELGGNSVRRSFFGFGASLGLYFSANSGSGEIGVPIIGVNATSIFNPGMDQDKVNHMVSLNFSPFAFLPFVLR